MKKGVIHNIKFPFLSGEQTGFFDLSENRLEKYQSRLTMLLYLAGTFRNPAIGVGMTRRVFDPADTILASEVKEDILQQAEEYMPEIFVEEVWVDTAGLPEAAIDRNALMLNILWGPKYDPSQKRVLRTPVQAR